MRKAVRQLLNEMDSQGVRLASDGSLHLSRPVSADLLLRAHRNRRALLAAVRQGQ